MQARRSDDGTNEAEVGVLHPRGVDAKAGDVQGVQQGANRPRTGHMQAHTRVDVAQLMRGKAAVQHRGDSPRSCSRNAIVSMSLPFYEY